MKENRFDPEDSIRAIHACAPVYLERLLGRHVLFVPGDGSAPMETLYRADNFMHLCGVHYENVSPKDFWEMALRSRLTPDGLLPNNRGVTAKRLVLSTLVRIDAKAIMMVESPVLPGRTKTDAICANLPYAVGYARRSSELFPNTALDLGDGRLNGSRPVLTVFKTERDSLDYNIVSKAIKEKDPVKRNQKLARVRGALKQYRGECVLDRAALGLL